MDVSAATRRLNFAVRHGLRRQPGTFGAIAYYFFMACTVSAFFDRDPATTRRAGTRPGARVDEHEEDRGLHQRCAG